MHRHVKVWARWFAAAALCVGLGVAHAASPMVWVPASNTVIKFYNAAADALNRGDPLRAEGKARKAIEAQETFGEAHLLLGTALARQGRLEEALGVLGSLDQRAPGRALVLTELAVTWFAMEDFGRADAYAMDAVGRNPDEDAAWQALTLVRRRTGDLDELQSALEGEQARSDRSAIACFLVQSLVSLDRREEAEQALMRCQELGGGQFVENAARALGAGLAQSSTGPAGLLDASTAAFNGGEYGKAAKLAGEALEAGAPRIQGLLLRAEARYRNGEFGASRNDLREVLGDQGSWVTVQRDGSITGALTDAAARSLRERLVGAAAVAVLLDARDGADWRGSLADARAAFEDTPRLRAAEVQALLVVGEAGRAWTLLSEALTRGDDPRGLADVAIELGFGSAAVASAGAIDLVRTRGTPLAVYNLASGLANANLAAECLGVVRALVGPANETFARDPGNQSEWSGIADPIRSLYYSCAVHSGGVDLAATLGAEAGWTAPLEFDDVWTHALGLLEAEKFDVLLALLEGSGAREGVRGAAATDMSVYSQVRLGDLDGALAVCGGASCGAAARLEVGIALVQAERFSDGKDLLERTCDELKGKQRSVCKAWLATSKGS